MNKLIKYEIDPFSISGVLNESEHRKVLEESLNNFVSNIKGTVTSMCVHKTLIEVPYVVYFIVQEDK